MVSHLLSRKRYIAGIALICLIVCGLVLFLVLRSDGLQCNVCDKKNISPLGEECSESTLGKYRQYAISTDSNICAPAGRNIIEDGGNAIDAAIAVQLCMGVTIPESLGLGGGSLITIYLAKTKQSIFIDAREAAPKDAHLDMFNKTGVNSDKTWSHYGVESIAVPGELAGHHHLYTHYGSKHPNITWKRLFRDAITSAEQGFKIGDHLASALSQKSEIILKIKELRETYTNPKTGKLLLAGEILKQPTLGKTLRRLSESADPIKTFYTDIAKEVLDDIRTKVISQFPGQTLYLKEEDFFNYEVRESRDDGYPLNVNGENITLYSAKLPGSGILLQFILRLMSRYQDLYPQAYTDAKQASLFYHRLMEAFKFAFANRQYLGDDRYDDVTKYVARLNNDTYIDEVFKKIVDDRTFDANDEHYEKQMQQKFDHGTAHLSVLDKEGNAVAITATVNLYFGSKVLSQSTGILLNDEMDDFNTGVTNDFGIPPAKANTIKAKKRPLSSMVPSIFTDDSGVRLVIGASGGPKIITAVAYTAMRHLFFKEDIKHAIDAARPHHQLHPDKVVYEACFPKDMVKSLEGRKHNTETLGAGVRGAIVMAIARSKQGDITANSDFRKGGTVAGV